MSVQTITAHINGKDYNLHVQRETYNNHPAWYLTDEDIPALFGNELPDNLVFIETDGGVEYSPRIMSVEGQLIAKDIWNAIKGQGPERSTPQPFGPGLG